MTSIINYNREKAVTYALEWAFKRNSKYLDFSNLGGDCTNFISQCLFAGSGIMNYTPTYGWHYINSRNRSPSWTGVTYLYNFLITNKKAGVFATNSNISQMQIGDIIQLGDENNRFYHSLIVTEIGVIPSLHSTLIATHSFDADKRPLDSYIFQKIRYLHIEGVYVT